MQISVATVFDYRDTFLSQPEVKCFSAKVTKFLNSVKLLYTYMWIKL